MPSNQHHPHGRCCNYIICVKRSKRSNRVESHAASASIAAQSAVATSSSAINLSSNLPTQLQSVQEINTAPTSYTQNGPAWNGSTLTAPWSGLSTAEATVSGSYDGSDGQGTLTFEVRRAGTHGEDNLRIRVLGPDGSTIENIDIDRHDPINQLYGLSNGLSVTFSAGEMFKNETFTVDVHADATFSTSPHPVESTAEPAISGVYDGSLGTDTLTFVVTGEGTHGTDDLSLDVYTSAGTLLESINVGGADPVDQFYSLSNGLVFSLDSGSLALGETFTIDVNHLVPTTVNPNLSFSGIGINDSKLEEAFTITDGSFEINGTVIDVYANDSINSVLHRINTAGIDISAAFDSVTDRILLSRNTPGSEHDIVLANDSSGFLEATKLSTALSQSSEGNEHSVLQSLSIMASVTSGSLSVNGVAIAIDVETDSLNDVLDRIEQSTGNVSASFDSLTGLVSISANDHRDLSISSGATGFFEVLRIDDGLYEHVEGRQYASRRSGYSASGRRITLAAMEDLARRMNTLFDDANQLQAEPYLDQIRNDLKAAIGDAFKSTSEKIGSDLGIAFDFSEPRQEVFRFSKKNQERFSASLKTFRGAETFQNLFFGESKRDEGLVDRLLSITKVAEQNLIQTSGNSGMFVDVLA